MNDSEKYYMWDGGIMQQYLDLCRDVLENGVKKEDRTGTGTISVFGRQLRFDLAKGFPIPTTKRTPFGLIKSELFWFIKGDTNIKYLLQHNNHIWDEWAFKNYVESDEYDGPDMTDFGKLAANDPEFNKIYQAEVEKFCNMILTDEEFGNRWGELGSVYGEQWTAYQSYDKYTDKTETIDQFAEAINLIKTNPDSRRILVNAWHPGYIKYQALPPCHYAFQFYVADGKLSCMFNMRSTDGFLGLAFNIPSYALLTHMVARECGLEVGELIYTGGDVHIYSNHMDQVNEQLNRTPRELPTLWINPEKTSMFDMELEDIKLIGYDPHPAIKAPVAV